MILYNPKISENQRYSKIFISIYVFLLLLSFTIKQPEIFKVFYLTGGIILGLYYMRLDSSYYISTTLIFFMFSPIVRRLVDWKFGTDTNSLILLTPSLMSILCGSKVIRSFYLLNRIKYAPYILALAGIILGFIIGCVNNGFLAAAYDFVSWTAPIFISVYIILERNLERNLQMFVMTIVYTTFLMGLYAVFQYIFAPPWDTQWLINSGLTSQGRPAPYSLRVWSTLNSTGIYAIFAMAGLLLAQFSRSYLTPFLYSVGFLGISLSLVRTAWIGLLLGVIVFLFFQKARVVIKYVALITLLLIGSYFLLLNTPFYSIFSARVSTLNDISSDGSFKERQLTYASETSRALFNVVGDGLGSVGLASRLSAGNTSGVQKGFDSGILNTLNTLGWLGTFLYLLGVVLAIVIAFPNRKLPSIAIAAALFAISLVCIAQMFSYSSNVGVAGLLFWTPLALASKIKKYRKINE